MKKALGTKTGTPTKKGTWGGSYQIEHNYSTAVSCYKCYNCVNESKSCRHYGMFIPVLGKNHWRCCKFFKLDLEYADKSNIDLVTKVKGNGYIEEEIKAPKTEKLKNKENTKKSTKHVTFKKKYFPKFIMENIALLCLNYHIDIIKALENALNSFSSTDFSTINFDKNTEFLFKEYLKNNQTNDKELPYFIYIISKEINCNIELMLSLDSDTKKKIISNFIDDDRFDTEDYYVGEHYILMPDNKTVSECTKLWIEEDIDYLDRCIFFPIFTENSDDVEYDDEGHLKIEDYKVITYFNTYSIFCYDTPYNLQFSFPLYLQQEHMELKHDSNICSHCHYESNDIDSEELVDNDNTGTKWKCPNCESTNDIYNNYFFKQIYLPSKKI